MYIYRYICTREEGKRDLDLSEDATDPVSSDAANGYTYLSIHIHIYVDRDTISISIDRYAPENDVRRDRDLSDDAIDAVSSEAAAVYLYLSKYTHIYVHR